ncbi:MAG: LCP family protein [Clostridia bacterium]|nr:LCP family protein [Clostridia bacterium]
MDKRKISNEVVDVPQKKKKSAKKVIIAIVAIILVLIIGVVGAVYLYMHSLGINFHDENDIIPDSELGTSDDVLYDDLAGEEVSEYHEIISTVRGDNSLSSTLYNWYHSGGDIMSSKNVLNILIIGVDSRSGKIQGNSDVMMLASINKKTQSITLCSFLRDSYTYFESSSGKGYYSKLTHAFSYGGADCLVKAIENNYKIAIDYFVAVDFSAFEKVIDEIGGVTLDVTQAEARAMENYGKISGIPYGDDVLLNGEQALLFARMRKIYASGDVKRTENQREVINAIIKKTKDLSISDLNNVVQTLGEYVYTDCSASKIISLGTNAILGQWYNYQVYSMESPPESARQDHKGNSWMWIVDYPYSAQYVQKQIYGETNIVIE